MKPEEITALKQTVARLVERRVTPAMDAIEAAGDALGVKDANRHPPRNRFAQEKT